MNLVIKMLDPTTLVPFEGNSKKHPPEQISAIAQSIQSFGFDQPIVCSEDLTIIKGHGRQMAAIQLGLKAVPVIIKESTDVQARLNRVLDNHLTSRDYDSYALREDLVMLQDKGLLEKSLLSANQIPDVNAAVARAEASLFSLITKHKCPQCSYRW